MQISQRIKKNFHSIDKGAVEPFPEIQRKLVTGISDTTGLSILVYENKVELEVSLEGQLAFSYFEDVTKTSIN